MYYSEFVDWLGLQTESQGNIARRGDGLTVVRAHGQWLDGMPATTIPGQKSNRKFIAHPFLAVLSSAHPDVEHRSWGIAIADSEHRKYGRGLMPLVRIAQASARVLLTEGSYQLVEAKVLADDKSGIAFPGLVYVEGPGGEAMHTLEVQTSRLGREINVPTRSPQICQMVETHQRRQIE